VLVLGAGETGSLFTLQAAEAGVRDIRIANRSPERAAALAAKVGGAAVAWETLSDALPQADLVVGATASPAAVVGRDAVERAMRQRRGKPMFFLDLAVPRNVDPAVAEIYNVYAYGMDELEGRRRENRRRRQREVPRGGDPRGGARGSSPGTATSPSPTLNDLQRRLAELRDAELARLPPEERDRFRQFADAIAAKLLHQPMRRLKSEPDASRRLDRVEAVRHLFDLDR
jgi:glutamyl-tRNA reductase